MKRDDLLPGVTVTDCPPVAVYDAHRAIRRARRKAVIYDAAQLLLLGGAEDLLGGDRGGDGDAVGGAGEAARRMCRCWTGTIRCSWLGR
jgi:hypothetical protein